MADENYNAEEAAELKKKRAFRKFSYRGIDLDQLLDLSSEQLRDVVHARARRRFNRGLKRKPMGLIKKLRKAKQEAKPNEKPDLVKTHLRDMIVVPEMIGSVIGIYSGKEFNQVEIKPEMVGHYLAEFSISYKPVKHGRPAYDLKFDLDTASSFLVRRRRRHWDLGDSTLFLWSGLGLGVGDLPESVAGVSYVREATVNAYKQLLGAFYHIRLAFSTGSFESTRYFIVNLANIADMYGCSNLVSMPIEKDIDARMSEVSEVFSQELVKMLELSIEV
ncbi:ribosomal protein S15 [Coniosporium tulheliwenetii]|uniref:Ribosomal protein S15 n=1 Tax=Coniosporium tulheliwenetii TaxID=3383036 RepID=A0ACC2ZHG3_9PEZI|nr:ribosomal protein S15 [Cladosporium sp. JES 115]